MSSSDKEAQSPKLGASSSKAPVTPMGSPDHSGEEDEREEVESLSVSLSRLSLESSMFMSHGDAEVLLC
jgi:hypothetical protein